MGESWSLRLTLCSTDFTGIDVGGSRQLSVRQQGAAGDDCCCSPFVPRKSRPSRVTTSPESVTSWNQMSLPENFHKKGRRTAIGYPARRGSPRHPTQVGEQSLRE